MTVPSENQYRMLRAMSGGAALVVGKKRDIDPMHRRGWVTGDFDPTAKSYHWSFVRITADGLRALAAAVDARGLPDIFDPKDKDNATTTVRVCGDCGSSTYRFKDIPAAEHIARKRRVPANPRCSREAAQ